MTTSQIQLNNLVEITMPITSKNIQLNCYIPPKHLKSKEDIKVEIEVTFPYTILLQKFDFNLDEQFCNDDFAKVFLFDKLQRRASLEQHSKYKDSLIRTQRKSTEVEQQAKVQNSSTFGQQHDSELEALRKEVMSCENSSTANDGDSKSPNIHSVKVCAVGTAFKIILKVSDNFGVDLTSAKEHPNKELQEDLRSLSRTMMHQSESEMSNLADEGRIQDAGSINQIQPQIGQLGIKNQETSVLQQTQLSNESLKETKQSNNGQQRQTDQPQRTDESIRLEKQENQQSQSQTQRKDVEKIFKRAFQQIVQGLKFYAWPCFRIPQANNSIPLINTSFLFESAQSLEEKRDIDFLIALSLMNGRKFIQAAEWFRRLENELLTQSNVTQANIDKCIQLEILIADSMNQHSQLSEKLTAFQRIVDFSFKQKIKPFQAQLYPRIHQIREEEAHKILMMLHPYLIKVLIQNIDSKLEAVKAAVLRNIEFLIDQIGCSMDQQLIHILIGVINTYPRSNLHFNYSILQNQLLPVRYGFFQQLPKGNQSTICNLALSNGVPHYNNFDNAIQNSYLDSIIYDQAQETEIIIKDGQNFQQTFQQNIKNLQNHILESFIQLLSSLSSQVLHQIFNEVIQQSVFLGSNPYENQLATDLRIYLLKFADKIISICQGDLILNLNFINNIVLQIIPDQRKLQNAIKGNAYTSNININNQAEISRAKQKTNETISLACQNLWQTCRQKLFANYSNKGLKSLLEWVFNNLVNLAENSDELTSEEQQRLTLVFDVIDLVTSQHSQHLEQQKLMTQDQNADAFEAQLKGQHETKNHQVQSLSGRETRLNNSRNGDEANAQNNNQLNQSGVRNQPLILMKNKQIATLELYALINPVLFWLDYSIEKLDRLPIFKMTWKTLNKILNILPKKNLDIDAVSVILPVLHKVNVFCQSSSPQLEMLQFLQVVLGDFISNNRITKELANFLDTFLITIAKCIPHHLHEEIFMVCEQIIELIRGKLKTQHITVVIEALIEKYTMRSKAHKKLTQYFIDLVLEESMKLINNEQQQSLQQQQHENVLNASQPNIANSAQQHSLHHTQMNLSHFNSQQQTYGQVSSFQQQQDGQDYIDNYEYERDSNLNDYVEEDEDQSDEVNLEDHNYEVNHQQNHYQQRMQSQNHGEPIHPTNQNFYNESPISQRIFNQQVNQLHGQQNNYYTQPNYNLQPRRSSLHQILNSNIETYFDILVDVCFDKNVYEPNLNDKHSEQLKLELYFEKLNLFLQTIKTMNHNHILLFSKLINKPSLKESLLKVLNNERSTLNAIEILEQLTNFYVTYCAPKNIYEHPMGLIQNINHQHHDQHHLRTTNNNNNQISQSSGYQQQQQHFISNHQNNRRHSTRNSFISSQHNNNNNNNLQSFQNTLRGDQLNSSGMQNNMGQLTHHVIAQPNQIYRYQQQNIEDDLLIDNLNEDMIQDELDIINRERLILIQCHALFIRNCIEQFEQTNDAYLQFHTLNMIDNLYSNLLPVPNFQNLIIKQTLQRQSGINNQHQKVRHYEIPDFEKFTIIDQVQTYNQLLHQSSQQPGQQQQSYVLSEFECFDLKYLHGRLQFAFRIWNFIEQSMLQSSWSNIKSICYGLVCQVFKIEISDYKQSYQNKIKQVLFPLLNSLLFSKESESKAGGLNILGSLCGLGHDFSNVHHFKLRENMSAFRKNSNFISLALWEQVFNLQEDWDHTIREAASVLIQICAPRQSIKHFNSIQEEKYKLKIQSMIKTYNAAANQSIRNKQYLGIQSVSQTPSVMINHNESVEEFKIGQEVANEGFTERNSIIREERKSIFRNYLSSTQTLRGQELGTSFAQQNERIVSDSSSSSGGRQTQQEQDRNDSDIAEYFYVDNYIESQIKELIAIFKNDYKPPKNLWIEKNAITMNYTSNALGSDYVDLHQQNDGEGGNIVDILEDRIVSQLNNQTTANKEDNQSHISNILDQYFRKKSDDQDNSNTNGDSEYLIFERHFESDKEKLGSSGPILLGNDSQKEQTMTENQNNLDTISQEDLGIIDLDEDEGGDEFDELDDDKLPILKNTYSKKHRPNNSKSVAIGSKTQGMYTVNRLQSNQNEIQQKPNEIIENEDQQMKKRIAQINQEEFQGTDEEDEILYDCNDPDKGNDDSFTSGPTDQNLKLDQISQDQKIEEYEQKIAQTINDLNNQLQQQKEQSPHKSKQDDERKESLVKSPQIQITATVKLNKRSDDFRFLKEKPKTNKSFDQKYKTTGLQSPIRGRLEKSTSNQLDVCSVEGIDKDSNLNQVTSVKTRIKKINDPLLQNQRKSYSSQASKLKSQRAIKKETQNRQRPQLISGTSPGQIQSSTLKMQSTKQTTNTNKSLLGSFGPLSSTNNARKRKSEYQRRSDVPPYSTLAHKKLVTSFLSQANNQQLDKSQDKRHHLSFSQVNNLTSHLDSSLSQSKLNTQSQQTLMQKAKQAFVSRAKSHSYLNSANLTGNNNSLNTSSNINSKIQNKKKEGSLQFTSTTNYLGLTNKSLTGTLGGYNKAKKGKTIKITNEEDSNGSLLNNACYGGIKPSIYKGYFSNDECERANTEGNKKKVLSPPRSGDLQDTNKQSFLSDEQQKKIKVRASSHHLKRKRHHASHISLNLYNDSKSMTLRQKKNAYPQKITKSKLLVQTDTSNNDSLSEECGFYKSTDNLQFLPQQEFFYPQHDPNLNQQDDDYHYVEDDQEDEDLEEFAAGEDSVRGQVKQLSCIDEEEDVSERKTIGSTTNNHQVNPQKEYDPQQQ